MMNNPNTDQRKLMYDYTYENRPRFNPELLKRSDDEIVQEIVKVIMSCQRSKYFLIRLDYYRVVENPIEIQNILYMAENAKSNKSNNNTNIYEYIEMKQSDIKLLILNYTYGIKDDIRTMQTIMAIPKVVNKYYFRILGNLYCAMYQLVDSSTYNNATNPKRNKDTISMKTMFMPIRITRNTIKLQYKKDKIPCVLYSSKIFSKEVDALKYIITKVGIYNAFIFLGINCINISTNPMDSDDYYNFYKHGIFINVPKLIFDKNHEVQSLVGTIYNFIEKDTTYEDIFSQAKWLISLGKSFGSEIEDKGMSVLESLEALYDISTYESINLEHRHKENIYCILRWLTREFNNLMVKSNLDISTKKIRCAEYIASLYAKKLSKGIHSMSDEGQKITPETIKKYLNVSINYLIKEITKCQLINYKNIVNDLDSFLALKYSCKGPSGLGTGKSQTVSNVYRGVHASEIGVVDMDSCNKSDPGTQGNFTPMMDVNYFSQYKEPCNWEDDFSELMNEYNEIKRLKDVVTFKKNLLSDYDEKYDHLLDDHYAAFKRVIEPIVILEKGKPIDTSTIELVPVDYVPEEESDDEEEIINPIKKLVQFDDEDNDFINDDD